MGSHVVEREKHIEMGVPLRANLCLGIAVLSWGIEYPIMKQATNAVGPLTTGAVMFSLAALLLGGSLIARQVRSGQRVGIAQIKGLPYGPMILIGCIGICLNLLGLFAVKLTRIVNVAALARSDALFSLLLSVFVFRETVARAAWFFVPFMLLGIGLLTGFLLQPLEVGNIGDYLVLGSALGVSLNAYIIKHAVQGTSGLTVGFINSGITAVFFVSVQLFRLGFRGTFGTIPGATWFHLVALGGLAFAFFATYNTALRTIQVWKVRLMCLLIPVVAALSGWLWLGEVPTWVQILGMFLISAGAAGIITVRRTPSSSHESSNDGDSESNDTARRSRP